jgi:hypothetical protein
LRAGTGSAQVFGQLWEGTNDLPTDLLSSSPGQDLGAWSGIQDWRTFELEPVTVLPGTVLWLAMWCPTSTNSFRPNLQASSEAHTPSKRVVRSTDVITWVGHNNANTLWHRVWGYPAS